MLCKHPNRVHIRSEPRPCGFWWVIERCEGCGKWFKIAKKEEPLKGAAKENNLSTSYHERGLTANER